MTSYRQQLKNWYDNQRGSAGEVVDLKFYPGTERELSAEEVAQEAFLVLSGQRQSIDETTIDC